MLLVNDTLYVSNNDNHLYALQGDRATCKLRFEIAEYNVRCGRVAVGKVSEIDTMVENTDSATGDYTLAVVVNDERGGTDRTGCRYRRFTDIRVEELDHTRDSDASMR